MLRSILFMVDHPGARMAHRCLVRAAASPAGAATALATTGETFA